MKTIHKVVTNLPTMVKTTLWQQTPIPTPLSRSMPMERHTRYLERTSTAAAPYGYRQAHLTLLDKWADAVGK